MEIGGPIVPGNMEATYIRFNRELWDKKTPYHLASAFYDVEGFLAGKDSLNKIELDLLGEALEGKKILHLQCHFGQDSLSLARRGAEVVGVDLSGKAVQAARDLAAQLKLSARFIQCNIFDLEDHLDESFDIVFTSYGVIGWLPDLQPWGALIHRYLKPGGQFIMAEFHPMLWMFDDSMSKIAYSYFNRGAIIEKREGTYADTTAPIELEAYNWNHSLADVLGGVLKTGLRLDHFQEYDYSPYDIFAGGIAVENGFQTGKLPDQLPYIFSVVATRPTQL
jgi:2-polyprenyl-3-methyl-5-hydroxy-6-metoxy-1,4-benzoquinol methylase